MRSARKFVRSSFSFSTMSLAYSLEAFWRNERCLAPSTREMTTELARRYHSTCEIFHFNYISFFSHSSCLSAHIFRHSLNSLQSSSHLRTFHLDDEVWRMCGNSWISIFLSLSGALISFTVVVELLPCIHREYLADINFIRTPLVRVRWEKLFRFNCCERRWCACLIWTILSFRQLLCTLAFFCVLRLRKNRKSTEAQSERRTVFPDSHNLGFGK